ncbi:MAG: DUF2203 domain-containing protein [Deltaproteobacteria bacterium]|nr:DUF2203 domain-containing protein [Deltaproteobacteria bacterium]
MEKRYFTLEQVNDQVARLMESFARVMQVRAQLKTLYRRLEERGFAPSSEDFPIVVKGAPKDVNRDRATFKALIEYLREEIQRVQETGCMIKDVEVGLVDWFSQKDGRDILLCWRFGEKEVSFWHDPDTGYEGRRPISELLSEGGRPRTGNDSFQ